MCRPVGGSREEACPGGHTGPPLRGVGSVQRSTEIGMKRRLVQRGGAEPAPYRGSGAGGCVQDGGVWSPRPMGATLVGRSSGPMYLRHGFRRPNFVPKFGASVMVIGPYGKKSKPHQPPGPAAHSGAFAPAGARKWVGIAAEIIPKGPSTWDNPSVTAEPCQLPLHKGAFGDGGYGLPRRFAPRNDSPDLLSFRGGPTGRRGNPSFLRWTEVRAAEVVGPYGRSTEVPANGPMWSSAPTERNDSPRDCRGSALSAERVAGQIRVLHDE